MTLEEFESLPTIMSSFPLTFEPGKQRYTFYEIQCNECHQPVPQDRTRGTVSLWIGPATWRQYRIEAHGLCPTCNKLSSAINVFFEDMTGYDVHLKTGNLTAWNMRRLTWWERFVGWFKALLSHWKAKKR